MLSLEEIKKVAKLSKLELTDEEMKKYQTELSGILDFFEKLKEVDTDGVEPLSQVTGLENVLRTDEVENFPAEKLLQSSPREKSQNMVSVPNVF
jgi:aspartyl-tRNA(Asn)/glutamyl-tRNA(Gln) amidotransferase subunit C